MAAKQTALVEHTVGPSELKQLIKHGMSSNLGIMIWGPPGIGKSDIIEQIGREEGRPVIDMRLLLLDATDLKGIPFYDPTNNTMKWAPPNELPRDGQGLDNAILFLDEITAAPQSIQASAYQLVLNRRVGEYVLPKGVSIVAAGNRTTDKGVAHRMPTPLANRFVHYNLKVNFNDWQQWAIDSQIHPDVIGYLSAHRQNLDKFDPTQPDPAYASPRSWYFVSKGLTSGGLPESLEYAFIAGTVGAGVANEFKGHRKFESMMPKPKDILLGKNVGPLKVKEVSAYFSLIVNMCYILKGWQEDIAKGTSEISDKAWTGTFDNYLGYCLDNFKDTHQEVCILAARLAFHNFALTVNYKEVKNWKAFHEAFGKHITSAR